MFQTLKSKIIALTITTLLVLFLLVIGVSAFNYENNKSLVIDATKYNIENYTEKINAQMSKLEDHVMSLALLGEGYFNSGKSDVLLNEMVQSDFKNYPDSFGGGVWFRPYQTHKNKRLKAVYAFYNDAGEVTLDPNFETNEYNYPMQRWYLEILPRLSQSKRVVWSTPYFEKQGLDSLMTTVGAGIYHDDQLIGLATVDWKMSSILQTISRMKPTPNSFVLFADKTNDYVISTTDKTLLNKNVRGLSLSLIPWYHENLAQQEELTYNNKVYIPYVKMLNNGMILIVNIPKEELFAASYSYMKILLSLLLIFSLLVAWGIYALLQKNVNKPVAQLALMAGEIGRGNLEAKIKLTSPKELASLADTLNKTATDLKQNLKNLAQISKAKEKIEAELSVAHQIQWDALPHQFPTDSAFECFASMKPAKDVGGDFYDLFFVDKTHLAFVMADVSGKGVTAALLMMSAKTMIRNVLKSGHDLKKSVQKVNKGLYDNNSRGMFVTAFIGILDLLTGEFQYVNAGHCPPLIKNKKGYTYLKPVPNLVLGVVGDFDYRIGKGYLKKNDRLFLYTDGVTEAQNQQHKLYGPDRLMKALNLQEGSPVQTLASVQQDIASYVKKAAQSDDITMMEILYYGSDTHTATFMADVQKWPEVVSFLKKQGSLSKKQFETLVLVVEEIFTNIAKYAYNTAGTMRLHVHVKAQEISLQFKDWGKPYNPLKSKKPNVRQSAKKRPIGGLGLFIVKKIVDKISYERVNNQNILSMIIKRTKE